MSESKSAEVEVSNSDAWSVAVWLTGEFCEGTEKRLSISDVCWRNCLMEGWFSKDCFDFFCFCLEITVLECAFKIVGFEQSLLELELELESLLFDAGVLVMARIYSDVIGGLCKIGLCESFTGEPTFLVLIGERKL